MSTSLDLMDSEMATPSFGADGGPTEVEEEELTADEVLQRLQDAWVNEKFAPELLEPQIEIIDCLMEQISRTEEHVATLEKGHFAIALHKMELQRVRYLISSYLRLRLQKIQAHVHHLLSRAGLEDEMLDRLTKEEAEFAKNYRDSIDGLFKNVALSKMPGRAADFNTTQTSSTPGVNRPDPPLPAPNLNATVFVKALENVRGVSIEDEAYRGRDEDLDLEKGSQHILRYASIRSELRNGTLKLV